MSNMKIIDLHTHTIFSDGKKEPNQFVAQLYQDKLELAKRGLELKAIALTDHDTLNAVEPVQRALKEFEQANNISDKLLFLPGIELSTQHEGQQIHVLGYFPHTTLKEIDCAIGKEAQRAMELKNSLNRGAQINMLAGLAETRYNQLTGKNFKYDLEKALNKIDGLAVELRKTKFGAKQDTDIINWVLPLPRELIRKALAKIGDVPEEVIGIYTARRDNDCVLESYYQKINTACIPQETVKAWAKEDLGKCRMPEDTIDEYMLCERAVELIASAKGKAFFAHPYEIIEQKGKDSFERYVLDVLVPAGLNGIECHYLHHDDDMTRYLLSFAKEHSLLVSGGTDIHCRENEVFGVGPKNKIRTPFELYEHIIK